MSRAAASSKVQALLLTQKAEVKSIQLAVQDGALSLKAIQTALKKKDLPELIGSYKSKPFTLFLFGYLKGKAGTENKHELPPPHDTVLLFGDAVIVASKDAKSWATPAAFTPEDYETFYTKAFGGFDELDEDAEEGDGEEDVDVAEDLVEEEADVAEEGKEFDGEDEEEEDEEEEEDDDGEADGEADAVEEAEEDQPAPKRRAPAKGPSKKAKRAAAAAAATGAGQIPYLHVSEADELKPAAAAAGCVHRERAVAALETLFSALLTEGEIAELEACIYRATLRVATQRHVGKAWSHAPFVELYKAVARQIAANFHPSSYVENTELFERWKTGDVTFDDISAMSSYELFEGRWRASFNAQFLREKRQEEGNKAMATDQFVCTRCWKRECTYYEMQTRSADEPMTIFITCLNCGKHWRQ